MSKTPLRSACLLLLFALLAFSVAAWCADGDEIEDEDFYHNFLTAVASAPEDGYEPYWPGREFDAAGMSFVGPHMPDFGAEVVGGGVSASYDPDLTPDDPRRFTTVQVRMYSPEAWDRVSVRMLGQRNPDTTRRSVEVDGHRGEIVSIPGRTRPVHALRIVVFFPRTIVTLDTYAQDVGYPGEDTNPLIDESIFLSVAEQLRPYPQ